MTEEAVRQYYEENKARYTQAGRRHARHILIEAGGDEKAAEEKARRAYERAAAGEDFAALARELSDDTGSKESGGDLGDAERSDFVGPFGDAVWSMKPGEMRGPVKTEFGWHVIKLEGVTPETIQSFEEVRAELETEYRHSQVEKAFGDAQEELDTRAFESSGDIAAVAAQMKLPVKRVERYTRAGSAELGATPKVTEAVFSPDVLAGRELRTVEIAPGKSRCARSQGSRAGQGEAARGSSRRGPRVCPARSCRQARRRSRRRSRRRARERRRLAGGSDEVEGRSRDAGPETGGSQGSRGARGSTRGRFSRAGAEWCAALWHCDTRAMATRQSGPWHRWSRASLPR